MKDRLTENDIVNRAARSARRWLWLKIFLLLLGLAVAVIFLSH